MPYGTLTTLDTLATQTNQTVAEIGEDSVFRGLQAALAAHNALLASANADWVEDTTDRQRRYGGADDTEFDEVDQGGRADASKLAVGVTVGFPLRMFQKSLQWTRTYFEETTGAEFAAQVTGILDADARNIYRQIRRAWYHPTNYNFDDVLTDNVTLGVKAFVNADGAQMPLGPNGESFDPATHTHFLARAGGAVAKSDIDALLDTVIEHHSAGMPILEINRAQEGLFRTGGVAAADFAPYQYANVVAPTSGLVATGQVLNPVNVNNRAIGIYRGAEVRIKPRVPANYLSAWMMGVPKPLVYRRPERNPARGDLRLVADNEAYPLRAQTRQREFGVAVWNRTNGAVLYIGGNSYIEPTIG